MSNVPEESAPIFYIGQHETDRARVSSDLISGAQDIGYDFLTTSISTPAWQNQVFQAASEAIASLDASQNGNRTTDCVSPLTLSDTLITPSDINASLVAVASPTIDLGSKDPIIRRASRQVLNAELAYAAFCGINNIIIHGPLPGSDVVQYGRAIYEGLGLGPYLNLMISMPMSGELEQDCGDQRHLSELAGEDVDGGVEDLDEGDEERVFDVWDSWHTIRTICKYSHKLSVALEVPRQLPSPALQSRWLSEPTRILFFQRTTFLRNAKGYPVLSKPHQQLLSKYTRLKYPPWLTLSDIEPLQNTALNITPNGMPDSEPTPAESGSMGKEKLKDPFPHIRYLRHLQQTQPSRPPMERFGHGYQDFLQSPLQPLTDNLESITYEVFEKDPVKYDWYERAIAAALRDLKDRNETDDATLTVAIVGAGRGPLVTRALKASEKTGIKIECFAVEKNPNAFVLLQHRNATDLLWGGRVCVVKADMREWGKSRINSTGGGVDILISELLGSFGDNELSPECLDGVQHVLKAGGVCIPQSYSAHLTPIATPRIHGDLLSRPETEKWELPWVVMLHQYDYLCTESLEGARIPQVKEGWSFSHPIPNGILDDQLNTKPPPGAGSVGGWVGGDAKNEHNTRDFKISFQSYEQGVCHGIAGYFETVLYASSTAKVELSTNPVTMEEKSKDMISWFPIFFPLKAPIYVPKNAAIVVSMWRQTDDRSVWYEWLLEVFDERKRPIALSELHSSKKNACLM